MQTDEGAGAAGVGANHEGEQAPSSIPPTDPLVPPSTTDESVPPGHSAPAPESGSVLRWMQQEDLLSIERVGVMCNKNNSHWILLVATGIANLTKDPPEKCVISTLDSFNGDNSYEACIFREFLKMYIHHHTGRTITDDLFIIYKVLVPDACIQRDAVNCGFYLGVYMTNLFDPTRSIQKSVEDSTRDKIISTRSKFYEFLRGKHQKNIDDGKYHSEFYNVHSIDNGRIFVPHHQIPAGETCVISSASSLNGKDTVELGLKELARINPRHEDELNDTIVQYFYYNKLNRRQNKTNRVFRCLSTFFITRMMREYRLDPSHCGYTTATPVGEADDVNAESTEVWIRGAADGVTMMDALVQFDVKVIFITREQDIYDNMIAHCSKHGPLGPTVFLVNCTEGTEQLQAGPGVHWSALLAEELRVHYFEPAKNVGMQTRNLPLIKQLRHLLHNKGGVIGVNAIPLVSEESIIDETTWINECDLQTTTLGCGPALLKSLYRVLSVCSSGPEEDSRKRPKEDVDVNDDDEEEAKRFCMGIAAQNGFGHRI